MIKHMRAAYAPLARARQASRTCVALKFRFVQGWVHHPVGDSYSSDARKHTEPLWLLMEVIGMKTMKGSRDAPAACAPRCKHIKCFPFGGKP
jgi:hypothetical protein